MPAYTQIFYHIVFSTKNRVPSLNLDHRDALLGYTWGCIKGLNCHAYQINAVEDHVHLFTSLHPDVALAKFVKSIKVSTNTWMKQHGGFPRFEAWQEAYGAFTHSLAEKPRLMEYVRNQQEHHKKETFLDEYRRLVEEAGLKFDERYLP